MTLVQNPSAARSKPTIGSSADPENSSAVPSCPPYHWDSRPLLVWIRSPTRLAPSCFVSSLTTCSSGSRSNVGCGCPPGEAYPPFLTAPSAMTNSRESISPPLRTRTCATLNSGATCRERDEASLKEEIHRAVAAARDRENREPR